MIERQYHNLNNIQILCIMMFIIKKIVYSICLIYTPKLYDYKHNCILSLKKISYIIYLSDNISKGREKKYGKNNFNTSCNHNEHHFRFLSRQKQGYRHRKMEHKLCICLCSRSFGLGKL